MNRIILIGNGFDLASDLKTSYEDFILWYFKSIFEKKLVGEATEGKHFYKDALLRVEYFQDESISFFANAIGALDKIEELKRLKFFYIQEFSDGNPEPNHARINLSSEFFKNLLLGKTWGEIESEYFKSLYQIKKEIIDVEETRFNRSKKWEPIRREKVNRLNTEFEFLRSLFEQYITEVENSINLDSKAASIKSSFFSNCFENKSRNDFQSYFEPSTNRPFDRPEADQMMDKQEDFLNNVVFINFNYTSNLIKQLNQYIGGQITTYSIREIAIHGNILNKNERGLIFGYGDDTSLEYRELEQDGFNEYLRFMKSTQYFHDDSYKEIISYINEDEFEVFIAGHSLSLSDRVLLKTIFENDNCKQIRFFHKGNYEDYRTLLGAATRHFDEKIKMRAKFLPYSRIDTIN